MIDVEFDRDDHGSIPHNYLRDEANIKVGKLGVPPVGWLYLDGANIEVGKLTSL